MRRTYRFASLALSLMMLLPAVASATIQVNATRVIYPVGQRSVTVNVVNTGKVPHLVKAWVDDGDADADPSKVTAPFLVTPPLARMEPEHGQALRLMHLGQTPATDRETVYYINILDVPPSSEDSTTSTLQFAIRTRLKIFLRPAKLPGTPEQAAKSLVWIMVHDQGKAFLEARNAAAYYVSVANVTLADGTLLEGEMVAPFATKRFPLPKALPASATFAVRWVSDHGGLIDGQGRLAAPTAVASAP
ncbi:fimbrial biogenesis chaperone [Stenotrophomonas lacuserhaii]|nr:fimbria/pilus periplasmic chaperone [Stenotrophomonas pennii]